ncbi:MAG: AMP-binding protein [Verrucomicrobiota bacterium]
MIIPDILEHNARAHPSRIALSAADEEVTYRELHRRVRLRAAALRDLGIGTGDRVAILAHNSIPYVEFFFAATRLGAAVVQLHSQLIGREIVTILRDAAVKAFLYERDFRDRYEEVRAAVPGIPCAVCLDNPRLSPAADDGPPHRAAPVRESDIALVIYTSGPGASPRGAMLSHRNLMAAAAYSALELGLSRNDIFLSCTQLPYLGGTGRLLRFFHVGAKVVLQPEFDPVATLRAIERRSVTHVLLTPSMIARILAAPEAPRFNLTTLRTVLYGGSWVSVDLLKRAIAFFRCGLIQTYAHVETTGVLTFLHEEDHSMDASAPYMRKLMSVGKESLGVEVRVVDETGREIAADGVGEVAVRGLNVFEGYLNDPKYTSELLRDGWLFTGDIASVDEDGYLYIVDRKRDTLMVEGVSVSLREIENVLCEHPSVKEAAVVSRPDFSLGEVPVAVVVMREGEAQEREAILEHCRRNLAFFKVPRAVEFFGALPRNAQGKVLKAAVRDRILARRS